MYVYTIRLYGFAKQKVTIGLNAASRQYIDASLLKIR
jgi:hypothetical protein